MISTYFRRLTIIRINKPQRKDVNEDLQWFSRSIGLFGPRDKEKSCFRVFIELLKASRHNKGLTSDEIAEKSHLSRATVIHHLTTLAEQGLIEKKGKKYLLSVSNLEELINHLQKEMSDIFKDLKETAEELDKALS